MRIFSILTVAMFVVLGSYAVAHAHEAEAADEQTETREVPPVQKTRTLLPLKVREETRNEKKETLDERKVQIKEEAREAQEKRVITREAIDEKRAVVNETREEVKKEVREENTLRREKKAEQLAERQKEQAAKRIERVKAYFEKITTRLTAATERLEKLVTRLESRAQKLATEKGVDVSKTLELIGVAKIKIAEANASIEQIKGEVVAMFGEGAEPKIVFEKARELLGKASDSVKAAHRALVEAIASLNAGAELRDDVPKTEKAENAETNE